jgi:hypothetical protein
MVFKNDSLIQMRLKLLVMAEILFYSNPRYSISCFYERNISDRPIQGFTGPFRPIQACTGPYWPALARTSISPGVLAELPLQPRRK